ncbi:hypothetical protein [Dyadobacter sp. 32]|uniref:hypothetical protein n=1 Tax=Dyadobacter sp. 32 TaxID=538966 RepID=UPI0011ECBAF3
MNEAPLLGTVAIRVPGQLLNWDADNIKFPNDPDAERYLSRIYRKGWNIRDAFGSKSEGFHDMRCRP